MPNLAYLFSEWGAQSLSVKKVPETARFRATLRFAQGDEEFMTFADGESPEVALLNVAASIEDCARWRRITASLARH